MSIGRKTALVTGATGFIGRHLCSYLRENNYQVTRLVRDTPIRDTHDSNSDQIWDTHTSSQDDPTHATRDIYTIYGDVTRPETLDGILDNVDVIFHLAGYTHVNNANADKVNAVNVTGTQNLLRAALAAKVSRIVYFSSSLATGGNETEHEPATVYGRSKRAAEDLLLAASRSGGIEAVCLRPVNVYGVGMKGKLMTLIRLIRKGLFPPLPELNNHLSLVGVRDLCQAAVLAAESPRANGEVFIVTDGYDYSMTEIERAIREASGRPQPAWSVPLPLLFSAACLLEVPARVLGLRNAIGLRSYRSLTGDNLHSNEKTRDKLGYNPASTFMAELPDILESCSEKK